MCVIEQRIKEFQYKQFNFTIIITMQSIILVVCLQKYHL